MHHIVEFRARFVEEAKFDREGSIVEPPGRNLAEDLRRRLEALSYAATDLEMHSHYGWAFGAGIDGRRYWLILAEGPSLSTWALYISSNGLFSWLARSSEQCHALATKLVSSLRQDELYSAARVTSVRRLRDFGDIAL